MKLSTLQGNGRGCPRSLRRSPLAPGRRGGAALLTGALFFTACGPLIGEYQESAEARAVVAVDSADPARLLADVSWLADDAREGRRAGTVGERSASRWIAERLESLGLEPAGEEGWFQEFTVPLPPRDLGTSTLAIGLEGRAGPVSETFGDPSQVVPLFCSEGGRAVGAGVFCGYGIVDEDLGWNDYEGLDVEGAIVVIVRGTPPDELLPAPDPAQPNEVDNPHGAAPVVVSGPSWGGAGSLFQKVMEAKRRGAAAVLVALHPDRGETLLRFDASRSAEANLPALMIDAKVAEALVPGFGASVRSIDATGAFEPVLSSERVVRVRAEVARETGVASNVLGRLPGRGAGRTVLIGAHFDHLGHGGTGSLSRNGFGEIHNGADDNASGTAVVLEVARLLGETPLEGDLVVALWSGEELGLLGSEHWAQNPTIPLASVGANLNLDMVGRAGSGSLQALGAGTAAEFEGWLEAAGPRAGLSLEVSLSGQGVGGSDHQTFLKRSIPAVHFFSGVHPDYHKPSDDVEGFEEEGAARVTVLACDLLRRMSAADELAWIEPPASESSGRTGGFRTRFGSVPEYSYDGKGLLLAGTSDGGPAERAGLLKGDLIVRIDDVEIEGLGDFMYVLNAHKPGDVVQTHYIRDDEQRTASVTLESSQVE